MSTSFSIWKKLDEDGDMAVRDGEYTVLFIKPDRAIELRDLLLREFPVAAEPGWCAACGKLPCNCPAPEPSEPDPDEVRRAIETGDRELTTSQHNVLRNAACAWLRSREQRPLSDAEQVYFAACRETERRAAEREHKERRERIATAVLAGLVANPRVIQFWPESDIDEFAQRRAHALIAALDKEQP